MEDNWKAFAGVMFGILLGMSLASKIIVDKQPEYTIVEDNAVETIISIKQGDDLTLLNVNRFEDGGGLWEVTYDGKSEPVTRRVE